jgi:hypothetical protein
MSSKWCNWCNVSAKDWSLHGKRHGELWTLEIKGVANRPLIDAILVSNYILSILHIIIGMGNSLVDAFLS